MKAEKFEIGPFRFTFRGAAIWWRYKVSFGDYTADIKGRTFRGLAGDSLHDFLSSAAPAKSENALRNFVRWRLPDVAEMHRSAETYTNLPNLIRRLE